MQRLTNLWCAAVLVVAATACSSADDIVADVSAADQAYWTLTLNHRAINLSTVAPWDTVRLIATPRTYEGVPITTDGLVATYTSSDTNRLGVDPNGRLRAKRTGTRIRVVARLSVGPITHVDTAFVNIFELDDPPRIASLSIDPAPGDSAKTATNPLTLTSLLQVEYASGEPIPQEDLLIAYRSSRSTVANVTYDGELTPGMPGRVTLTASTYAFGVSIADTLAYTIGHDVSAYVPFIAGKGGVDDPPVVVDYGPTRVIGLGATVTFQNTFDPGSEDTRVIDLVFDDTTGIEIDAGSAPEDTAVNGPIPGFVDFIRRFTKAGTYVYRDRNSTVVGTIRVIDDSAPGVIP